MSELLSSLLRELVLLLAVLTAAPAGAEPASRTEPSAAVPQAIDGTALAGGRPCAELDAACSAARMRWQVTLPAAALRRCRLGGCETG